MRFDLYRPVEEEQAAWSQLAQEKAQREHIQPELTPAAVDRLKFITQTYPWLDLGVAVALTRSGADPAIVEQVATLDADARGARG